MLKGKLSCGYEYEMNEEIFDNMELMDAIAESDGEEPLALVKVCNMIFSKEEKEKLYNCLRKEDGRVPVTDVSKAIVEIISGDEKTKNF